MIFQRNQTLRLRESLGTDPDNVSKRLRKPSWAIQSSENSCMTSPGGFVIPKVSRYTLSHLQWKLICQVARGCCALLVVLEATLGGRIGGGCLPSRNLVSTPHIGCWIWLGQSLWVNCPFWIQSGVVRVAYFLVLCRRTAFWKTARRGVLTVVNIFRLREVQEEEKKLGLVTSWPG